MSSGEFTQAQRAYSDLFVYESEDFGKTPFDAFLECTDEKLVMGGFIGAKLDNIQAQGQTLRLLDIGCGDGSLAAQAIAASTQSVEYTGLDPVSSSVEKAKTALGEQGVASVVFQAKFEECDLGDQKFDAILASNLYHLSTEDIPSFLRRAGGLLYPHGNTFFVYRANNDDILDMRRRFEKPLYEDFREPRTIHHVMQACHQVDLPYGSVEEVTATVEIPTDDTRRQKVIEFILNRSVASLDPVTLDHIRAFTEARHNSLRSVQAVMSTGPSGLVSA